MEILNDLIFGFSVALSWKNLLWCFLGVTVGTLIGLLPGLGPMATISLLLPLTYATNDAVASIILLAGIYYGAQYGGSITAILLKLPGEASSVITCIDGYAMTQRGRAGAALTIAAGSSFVAGTVATLVIAIIAEPVSNVVFLFGPAEYAGLMLVGCLAAVLLGQDGVVKGIGMVCLGILLGLIGTDILSGHTRFTTGSINLEDGISFAVIAMGIFGLGEIIHHALHGPENQVQPCKIVSLYPTREEVKQSVWPSTRGTVLGCVLGILPGVGPAVGSFVSYSIEKIIGQKKFQFGQGAVAGLAGPEAANNAVAQTGFVPMLAVGIPTNPIMALMLAVLVIHNIPPGPTVLEHNPALFWGLIASMWIGNFFLLILNLPLIGIWIKILSVPRSVLITVIIAMCILGTYSINNNWFDVWLLIPFALMGYVLRYLACNPAPLAMGFVVGPSLEQHMRRALVVSDGDWQMFFRSDVSLSIWGFLGIMMLISIYLYHKHKGG